jgi:hypothetical protein
MEHQALAFVPSSRRKPKGGLEYRFPARLKM